MIPNSTREYQFVTLKLPAILELIDDTVHCRFPGIEPEFDIPVIVTGTSTDGHVVDFNVVVRVNDIKLDEYMNLQNIELTVGVVLSSLLSDDADVTASWINESIVAQSNVLF